MKWPRITKLAKLPFMVEECLPVISMVRTAAVTPLFPATFTSETNIKRRCYATGDLGYFDSKTKEYYLLGRIESDRQVKIEAIGSNPSKAWRCFYARDGKPLFDTQRDRVVDFGVF